MKDFLRLPLRLGRRAAPPRPTRAAPTGYFHRALAASNVRWQQQLAQYDRAAATATTQRAERVVFNDQTLVPLPPPPPAPLPDWWREYWASLSLPDRHPR
jgi:hypothetical protein